MKPMDILGIVLIFGVAALGGFFLLKRNDEKKKAGISKPPPGATTPKVPAQPVQPPAAPPQPSPLVTGRRVTNELDAGIAGINAGRDVLLAGIKALIA